LPSSKSSTEADALTSGSQPSGFVGRALRRQRHTKHPSRKVKLIISTAHSEEVTPSAVLACANERKLRQIQPEPRNTNSRGSFAASLLLMGRLLDRKRPSASISSSNSKKPALAKSAPIHPPANAIANGSAYKAGTNSAPPAQLKKSSTSSFPDRANLKGQYDSAKLGGKSISQSNLLLSQASNLTPTMRPGNIVNAATSAMLPPPHPKQFPPWQIPSNPTPSSSMTMPHPSAASASTYQPENGGYHPSSSSSSQSYQG
jgi:hypothetical protein